jgi:hypothetical protein
MMERDRTTRLGGVAGGGEGRRADLSTGQLGTRQGRPIEGRQRYRRSKGATPQPFAFDLTGLGEVHGVTDAAQEGRIEVLAMIGGEDGQTGVALEPLQQVADFDVGMAVMALGNLAALAE